jgi:hypothetical protein
MVADIDIVPGSVPWLRLARRAKLLAPFRGGSKMNHRQEREGDPTGSRRRKQSNRTVIPRLTLRIDFDGARAIGPGKIKLMKMIDKHGSISEAGRQMGMSYRRAWLLVDSLNRPGRRQPAGRPARWRGVVDRIRSRPSAPLPCRRKGCGKGRCRAPRSAVGGSRQADNIRGHRKTAPADAEVGLTPHGACRQVQWGRPGGVTRIGNRVSGIITPCSVSASMS